METTTQGGNAMSPESVGSQGLDIIDRLRACETRPLVTMSEECGAVARDTAAWVELWCTLNEARREIAKLRILLKATAITVEERDAVRWASQMIPAMAHNGAAIAHCHAETLRKLAERL